MQNSKLIEVLQYYNIGTYYLCQKLNQWISISSTTSITTCSIVPSPGPPTPESQNTPLEILKGSKFRFRNYFTPIISRLSPLPILSWADSREVWQSMLKKECHYIRDQHVFKKHPSLQPRMRAILLDWIIEVCEVYRLHRETFYLSVDFIDRFLLANNDIQKNQLQLIGITALFIAAKLESLNWDLSPVTVNGWLNVYLQLANIEHMVETEHGFVYPQFSSHAFVQIVRLLDLCMLDIGCLQFTYSVLAASALYHLTNRETTLSVSGFQWMDILPCVNWMAPFATTIREAGYVEVKFFPNVSSHDAHNIQTHAVDLNLLEKAQERQEDILNSERSGSPDIQAQVITQLTPPQSDKKPLTTLAETVAYIVENEEYE
ncbi:hypothetical protein KUTeg_019794 [Tegillarca granosa]|uniref:Cyclin N-terminal domain-containing protein n=1 Tax=Tegillarca granosa TaxID=220873 RepID=A0ABQ9EDN1_TEGGR|nr:hypothetical protein KUTeg_019794 [Tegillarca granosa]